MARKKPTVPAAPVETKANESAVAEGGASLPTFETKKVKTTKTFLSPGESAGGFVLNGTKVQITGRVDVDELFPNLSAVERTAIVLLAQKQGVTVETVREYEEIPV